MRERGYITRAVFLDHIRRDWRSAHSIRRGIYDYVELDYTKVKGLTAKSIPYAGATGYLTEDNAELSWDYSTDTLNVGTISISDGSIIDSGGNISFGNENLVTTGTLGTGNATLGTIACNEITIADGHGLNLQEDITFTGATTVNQIKFPDNLADALSFKEGANFYQTFITTNGSEAIKFHKNVINPSQPCFLAYNSADDDNETGDGTAATVDFDTEIYDQGGDFAADTFTAPVDGRYLLVISVILLAIGAAHSTGLLKIETSNRNYNNKFMPSKLTTGTAITIMISAVVDMDANDTAVIKVTVSGGAKVVDIDGSAAMQTCFSGALLC